jgi:non-ribosomal peptide synthetase component E (peptide arylation enzyme)
MPIRTLPEIETLCFSTQVSGQVEHNLRNPAYSFKHIGQVSDRLACEFQSLGVRRGNRVEVMLLVAARTLTSSFLLEEKP